MVYIKVSNKLKKKIVIFPVLILTFLGVTGCSATAPEFSTFSSNDEGWVVIGDPALPYEGGGSYVPEYGGEYAGEYIWVEDSVLGGVMYWVAPSKYLGDKSHYHGKYLQYDLREFYRDGFVFPAADVWLVSNDGTTLVYFSQGNYANYTPDDSWNNYEIKLDSSAGWKNATGISLSEDSSFPTQYSDELTFATDTQISGVLGSLAALYIRAEFTTGEDIDALDNVYFDSSSRNIGDFFSDFFPW